MRFIAILSLLIFGFLSISLVSNGQTGPVDPVDTSGVEITSEKIQQFIEVSEVIDNIQKDGQQEMIQAIREQDMDVRQFNEMAEMLQNPEQEETLAITAEEKVFFDNAYKQVQEIQLNTQQRMEDAVIDAALEVDEYNRIMQAYQTDPTIREKVDESMKDERELPNVIID